MSMRQIDDIIDDIIAVEGGFADDPNDGGGATKFGVTEAVARAAGYRGEMRDMPVTFARMVYFRQYVVGPNFDEVLPLHAGVAAELVDTGVNMGPGTAVRFLQQALNAFNKRGQLYPDVGVDGQLGLKTIAALRAFLLARGAEGAAVLLSALNALQCARYLELAEARPADEDFVYGWVKHRVRL